MKSWLLTRLLLIVLFFQVGCHKFSHFSAVAEQCASRTSPAESYAHFSALHNTKEYSKAFQCLSVESQRFLLRASYASGVLLAELLGQPKSPVLVALGKYGIHPNPLGRLPTFEEVEPQISDRAGLYEDLTFAGAMMGGKPLSFGKLSELKVSENSAEGVVELRRAEKTVQGRARFLRESGLWLFDWRPLGQAKSPKLPANLSVPTKP